MAEKAEGGAVEHLRTAVLAAFPDLAGKRFVLHNKGWDSVALDVGDRMIFKFPRNAIAERRLRREAGILAALHTRDLHMTVPRMVLHAGPPLFSSHRKLPGTVLEPREYAALPDAARARLAHDLARFFAALHELDVPEMRANGAGDIVAKADPALALSLLPRSLRPAAEALLRVPPSPDPLGAVFGYFDAHGWNMAFDHTRQVLNGIFDFADSGIGPLHCEFIAPRFLGPDLPGRIALEYTALTGKSPDPERIHRLTGLHRLQEIVETDDVQMRPKMIAGFASWVGGK